MRKSKIVQSRYSQITAEKRRTVADWWLEFEASARYQKLKTSMRYMLPFAAYVSKEYLFCSSTVGARDCEQVSASEVEKYLLITAPNYIVVDDIGEFVAANIEWLHWLCSAPERLIHSSPIESFLHRARPQAIEAMNNSKHSASKELILQARESGVDLANNEEILNFFIEKNPRGKDYYHEFLLPPHPIFDKGIMLYVHDWPPTEFSE